MKKIEIPPLVELLRMFLKQCVLLGLAVAFSVDIVSKSDLPNYGILVALLVTWLVIWPLLIYVMGFSMYSLEDEDEEKDKDEDNIDFMAVITFARMCLKTAIVFGLAIAPAVFIDDANDFSLALFYSLLAVFWVLSIYIMGARWVTLKVALGVDEEEKTSNNQEENTATQRNQKENIVPSSQDLTPPPPPPA